MVDRRILHHENRRVGIKEVEEIIETSRRTDWLDEFGVSDWDVRNKALEGVYKKLQRMKRELML